MTATCTLCGTLLTVEPDAILDVQRDDRTIGRLGHAFRQHMGKHHVNDPQRCLDPAILQGNIGQLIAAMGITVQGLVLLSYLESADEVFQQKTQAMREIISKAIEQKQREPILTP